jgi:hypothetical protein
MMCSESKSAPHFLKTDRPLRICSEPFAFSGVKMKVDMYNSHTILRRKQHTTLILTQPQGDKESGAPGFTPKPGFKTMQGRLWYRMQALGQNDAE